MSWFRTISTLSLYDRVRRVMDAWAYRHGIQLGFIRRGKPVENGFIESFNGRLRDECLNVEIFFTLDDVWEKLAQWREDYNFLRPHSSLQDNTPVAFAAHCSIRTVSVPPSQNCWSQSREL